MNVCSVDGCERLVNSRGLCNAHYDQERRAGRIGTPCIVPGCTRARRRHGICDPHTYRVKRHGDLYTEIPLDRSAILPCRVDGCGKRAARDAKCKWHLAGLTPPGGRQVPKLAAWLSADGECLLCVDIEHLTTWCGVEVSDLPDRLGVSGQDIGLHLKHHLRGSVRDQKYA
jgi:hypothetical protein